MDHLSLQNSDAHLIYIIRFEIVSDESKLLSKEQKLDYQNILVKVLFLEISYLNNILKMK